MDKIAKLRAALKAAAADLSTDAVIADANRFTAKEAEIVDLEGQLERALKAEQRQAALGRPHGAQGGTDDAGAAGALVPLDAEMMRLATGNPGWTPPRNQRRSFDDCVRAVRVGTGYSPAANNGYRNFGEFLQSVFAYYQSRGVSCDARLVRAPQGGSEVDPTGGGFLVQTDFVAAIFMLAHDMGEILGRVTPLPIGPNSNGIKVRGIDETSRATGSRFGGVQSYWAGEGTQVTATKPKFRLVEFGLNKLMSVAYITDELLQDSTALTSIYGQAFSEEVMFMTEDGIFEGSGAGQPLGIVNSPALITVPKENGQAAGTIVKENIDKVWARMWPRSRKNAIWLYNQDIEPQLLALNQAVGTGGQPVYLPPGGYANAPDGSLLGRPLIAVEYASPPGTPGDLMLTDLSQYYLADKGGVQAASSMHIAFLTDEMAFRITYRVDGKPIWHAPISPFKGTLTKSPFVAIGQR